MKIQANVYNEATDEGLLELELAEYEECFFVDTVGMRELLDEELSRLKKDLQKAKEESAAIVSRID